MTAKQISQSGIAPDGSFYVTLTDGAGNLSSFTSSLITNTAPTLTANGQGGIGSDSVKGLVLEGQGSSNDWSMQNKSGTVTLGNDTGTSTLRLANGGTLIIGGAGTFSAVGVGGSGMFTRTINTLATITYSASMTPDASAGNSFTITANNGTAFTINAPTSPSTGQEIVFTIRNTSGGALGTITWNAVFKMAAFTAPGNGNSRSIAFHYDGTNWIQRYQSAADVPN